MAVIPKGVVGDWDLTRFTPTQIEEDTVKLIADMQALVDSIGAVPLEEATYDSIIKPIELLHRDFMNRGCVLDSPQHCVGDKAVRDASSKAEEKMEEFDVAINMRSDVFQRIVKVQKTGTDAISAIRKRFVDRLVTKGRRYGLHLSEEVQGQVKQLKTKESELSIKFSANLNEDDTKLHYKKDDLVGLPEDLIKEFPVGSDGLLEVTIKYNHMTPVLKKCRVPATRKAMVTAANRKCIKENTPLLEQLVSIRHQLAVLLGFPTHAAFILDDRMAKTTDTVANFLEDLKQKLAKLVAEERTVMLDLKKEECSELGIEYNNQLDLWDIRYYMNMVEEKKYAVDHTLLQEYFPLSRVLDGMFDIYQRLLGVQFAQLENVRVWHEDVRMYSVTDTASKELLGYFFLDLHPRPGKYSHACVVPLQRACRVEEGGERQVAVAAMLCNFTTPTKEKPALLEHSEVETIFHEFGHAMHNICSMVDVCMLSGTAVARDFVEAPSQMLENWVWEKAPLALMSQHYKTGAPIPDDLLSRLAASRTANAGFMYVRQVFLSLFDQTIFSRPTADTAVLYAELQKEIVGVDAIPETNMPASFGHLGGGYDAQYYGYLWSQVYSTDMFATRFAGKELDSAPGLDYRRIILERGNSVDAMELLVEFIGREPNNAAFFKNIVGLK